LRPRWIGDVPNMREEKNELAAHLLRIAKREDGGAPKTGRRFYYLALSHAHVAADMSDTVAGKKSRDSAYHKVLDVLGTLRMRGDLPWHMVLDLTRELDQWQTYGSPREARAALRASYDEDRWRGQPYFPLLVVEKDTLEPVCQPIAESWQMPFTSSRGYGSLSIQHEVAKMLQARKAQYGQDGLVYFASDLDPSGVDLQRAWQDALANFGVYVPFRRIALTPEQVRDHRLARLSIEVKPSDSRAQRFIEEYGPRCREAGILLGSGEARCWEADILPVSVIEQEIDRRVRAWLDAKLWNQRATEIERARALL
jgi:hypothetical protein